MKKYSRIFETIFDESMGNRFYDRLGRYHHFSVIRVYETGQKIILIWDEDHDDERFIPVVENLIEGAIPWGSGVEDILAIGERKANLSIVSKNVCSKPEPWYPIPRFDDMSITLGEDTDGPEFDVWHIYVDGYVDGHVCNGTGMFDALNYLIEAFGVYDKKIHEGYRDPDQIYRDPEGIKPAVKKPDESFISLLAWPRGKDSGLETLVDAIKKGKGVAVVENIDLAHRLLGEAGFEEAWEGSKGWLGRIFLEDSNNIGGGKHTVWEPKGFYF